MGLKQMSVDEINTMVLRLNSNIGRWEYHPEDGGAVSMTVDIQEAYSAGRALALRDETRFDALMLGHPADVANHGHEITYLWYRSLPWRPGSKPPVALLEPDVAEPRPTVPDLLAALEESVAAARAHRRQGS